MAMTKGLVNQIIEIMGRNTDTFKEAVECYVDIKKEIITIKDRLYKLHDMKKEIKAIKNTQIDILKMINKMEQK
jgi:phosphomevalonate kinase